jgi:hypothetical protein
MRGTDHQQSGMFSYISAEQRVPSDHPLRTIRLMVDGVLRQLGPRFDSIYARISLSLMVERQRCRFGGNVHRLRIYPLQHPPDGLQRYAPVGVRDGNLRRHVEP